MMSLSKRSRREGPRSKRAFIGGSRLGFEGVYRHDLRKTVVTLMDEAGWSVQSAANQLGHVKPRCLHIWTGRNGRDRVAEVVEDLSRPELPGTAPGMICAG
jgi:hypothetical protein